MCLGSWVLGNGDSLFDLLAELPADKSARKKHYLAGIDLS